MSRCYGFKPQSSVFPLRDDDFSPCPSGSGCCATGDTCLSNNICHFNKTQPAGFYSGYYIAACNDPTFTSPACPKQCTSFRVPDIVYNYTSSKWACCGTANDGTVSCNKPTKEIMQAPRPEDLTQILAGDNNALASSSTTTADSKPSSTTIATATDTAKAGAEPLSEHGEALTRNAKISIGISITVSILLLLTLLGWLLYRHCYTRRKQHCHVPSDCGSSAEHYQSLSTIARVDTGSVNSPSTIHEKEVVGKTQPQELDANR